MDTTTSIKGNATKRPITAQKGREKEGRKAKIRSEEEAEDDGCTRNLALQKGFWRHFLEPPSVLASVLASVIFMRVFYLSLASSLVSSPFGANIFII